MARPRQPDPRFALRSSEDVTWDEYEAQLRIIGNRQIRVNYDSGEMEIMSPLRRHGNGATSSAGWSKNRRGAAHPKPAADPRGRTLKRARPCSKAFERGPALSFSGANATSGSQHGREFDFHRQTPPPAW